MPATAHRLLKTHTAGYRPVTSGGSPALWSSSGSQGFSLSQVAAMREDAQVSLCLGYRGTPITVARLQIKARSPEVARFVRRQFKRLWSRSLPVALEMLAYGRSGSEVLYRKKGGRLQFDELKYLSPRDVEVWTKGGRRHFVRLNAGGGRSGPQSNLPGAVDLPCARGGMPAKGFWLVHDPLHDPWYGRSVLVGAWLPWRLKTLPGGGGMDALAKWFYRHAYRGFVIRHPDAIFQDDGEPAPVSAQDLAQQMAERMKSGSDLAMSNATDENGKYLWVVESYGEVNGNAADLVGYVKDFLDVQIQRGIGIPDGIVTDGASQGFAGRKIPEDAYYAGCELDLNNVVETFDEQVVHPLVGLNFGRGNPYLVEPLPLVPTRQQATQDQQQGQGQGQKGGNPLAGLEGGGQKDSGPGGTFPMSLGGKRRMAAGDEWESYHGKRTTATAWVNPRTKEVRYQETKPGSRHTGRGEGAADRRDAATRSLKEVMKGGWEVFKTAGRKARHVERVAHDWADHGVDERIERLGPKARGIVGAVWKLTKLGTKAAFATYIAGQRAARAAAEEAGASPEQAARLAGFCTALDLAGAKAVPLTLAVVGLGGLGLAASFLPVGSLAYLAYSTARHPVRTAKAALKAVRAAKGEGAGKKAASLSHADHGAELARFLRDSAEGGDWYESLAYAALSEASDLAGALDLADVAIDQYPDAPDGKSRMAAKATWVAYVGQRGVRKGQRGWKNPATGRVVWGDKPPQPKEKAKKAPAKKPAPKKVAPKKQAVKKAPAKAKPSGKKVAPKKTAPVEVKKPSGKKAATKKAPPAKKPARSPAVGDDVLHAVASSWQDFGGRLKGRVVDPADVRDGAGAILGRDLSEGEFRDAVRQLREEGYPVPESVPPAGKKVPPKKPAPAVGKKPSGKKAVMLQAKAKALEVLKASPGSPQPIDELVKTMGVPAGDAHAAIQELAGAGSGVFLTPHDYPEGLTVSQRAKLLKIGDDYYGYVTYSPSEGGDGDGGKYAKLKAKVR